MPALPKLSYVLLSHNREKYIRRAIESAFAQDYEGELEYIFSDDCSTDRTFEIIQECVRDYKGDRKVIVTQTPHNMHLAGNTNHAVSFATSDWIIRADDDDIACVDRCSIIGKAIAEHPEATFVYTRERHFTDKDEDAILKLSRQKNSSDYPATIIDVRRGAHVIKSFCSSRCSHRTWHARVYRDYGPLPLDGYYVDDVVCSFRANMMSYGILLEVTTVYIRQGSGNMSLGGDDGQRGYQAITRLEKFNDKYFNITLPPLCAEVERLCDEHKSLPEVQAQELDCYILQLERELDYRRMMATFWRDGMLNRIRINKKLGKKHPFDWVRILPMPLYAAILAIVRAYKKLRTKR